MHAILDHAIIHSPTISSYFFKPAGKLRYVPGEYTELYIPHHNPDNRGESRKFTIASAPHQSHIEILTTFAPPHKQSSTFKNALRKLQPGDSVQLSETTGDFVLPKDPSIHVHFVAAGVGISPALSIVRHLAHTDEHRVVTITHGLTDRASYFDETLFNHYCHQYQALLKRAHGDWHGQTGAITARRILALVHPKPDDLLYISGPASFVTSLHSDLLKSGIDSTQIVTDLFTGY